MKNCWTNSRSAGIMMHISCLPSNQGIGCFDKHAYSFVDFLHKSGIQYWQICPLSPTGFGDSPYQGSSSFAINPYFINFEPLNIKCNLNISTEINVNFANLYSWFSENLINIGDVIFEKYKKEKSFIEFQEKQSYWLNSYALFSALKYTFTGTAWSNWPKEFLVYNDINIKKISEKILKLCDFFAVLQYVAHVQWQEIKQYALRKNVKIIGDLPMFPGFDSADVWSSPEIFQLNKKFFPTRVAGVPPDYFSPEGQLWGNPIYNWNFLEKTNYMWWKNRMKRNLELFDVLRLDHFRGFDRFWSVQADSKNAINGRWEKAHGEKLLKNFNKEKLIAEDLGEIDESAENLKNTLKLPGMKVLQFAFSQDAKNIYLPHNLTRENILYIGTHDNDTLIGWYNNCNDKIKDQIRKYFGICDDQISWKFITEAYRSPCFLTIICVQDLLNLNSNARFNTPGSQTGNWQWRMSENQLSFLHNITSKQLMEYKMQYDR